MRKPIIQTSCSELLVDTAIYDPEEAFQRFSKLFKELNWNCNPDLSVEFLKQLKACSEDEHLDDRRQEIMVYDKDGNRAFLEYGDNGYLTTGFRFDSQCNHGDSSCYPIFKAAIDKLNGQLIACDGGSTVDYEEWAGIPEDEADNC